MVASRSWGEIGVNGINDDECDGGGPPESDSRCGVQMKENIKQQNRGWRGLAFGLLYYYCYYYLKKKIKRPISSHDCNSSDVIITSEATPRSCKRPHAVHATPFSPNKDFFGLKQIRSYGQVKIVNYPGELLYVFFICFHLF